jgi:Recombinase
VSLIAAAGPDQRELCAIARNLLFLAKQPEMTALRQSERSPIAWTAKAGAKTLQAIADALNSRGVATARGGSWHPSNVKNVLARAD